MAKHNVTNDREAGTITISENDAERLLHCLQSTIARLSEDRDQSTRLGQTDHAKLFAESVRSDTELAEALCLALEGPEVGGPAYVSLDSVGSVIDISIRTVYPLTIDLQPDIDNGIHLDDVDEEWLGALSTVDRAVVNLAK